MVRRQTTATHEMYPILDEFKHIDIIILNGRWPTAGTVVGGIGDWRVPQRERDDIKYVFNYIDSEVR